MQFPVWVAVMVLIFIVVGLGGGGLIGLLNWFLFGTAPGLVDGLIRSAQGGALGGVVTWLLVTSSQIEPKEQVFWSWAELRRQVPVLVPGAGLVSLLIAETGLWLLSAPDDVMISILVLGLIMVVVYGPFIGGFGNRVSAQRSQPNQGVHTSLRNGLRLGIVGVPLFFSVFWLGSVVLPNDSLFVWDGWWEVSALVVVGFYGGFWLTGGAEVLKHYSLRLALALQGRLPLNLVRFLDHAARLIILTPVGGGWVFIHRLLQEHLAAQAADTAGDAAGRR